MYRQQRRARTWTAVVYTAGVYTGCVYGVVYTGAVYPSLTLLLFSVKLSPGAYSAASSRIIPDEDVSRIRNYSGAELKHVPTTFPHVLLLFHVLRLRSLQGSPFTCGAVPKSVVATVTRVITRATPFYVKQE